ncbi:phosphatidylinositol 3,4,5-trisphosphate 3-phosphatase and dual-specificity protein phosphatase PTEN-like [Acropora millepora]|uniref:phosphatidylinositol 3,4,5-trisphosphate 3-phosphatase and dual-specificity protein phosphatase PTEN-like n=1 Tax=Acropora millepora TaxID=45264 RepID=UPI001CF2ABC9|nr:phosphatidylinositol 3,4,5-trisphosphate 3-phosphatase and dual-specificity protein phosphatase PTEN-like [Acropora millepora]
MMSILEFFKHRVRKKKRRFNESGFDLDLTYIKPNIVAMGFPSENFEGVYRNHIDEVIRFLELKHKDHYKVYNLCSERHYDPAKFNNRVATFPFDDHNAPPFELIRPFCDDLDSFLKEDSKNVAFIHCKDDKGRTGVMISAYLLHNEHFKESTDALKYYGDARTRNAKGVTIPSQRRYVLYYNHLLRNELKYTRTMVLLKCFKISPPPLYQNTTWGAFYIIWQQKLKLYQSKPNEGKLNSEGLEFDVGPSIPICGDVKVEFFQKDMFKKERMLFQFWFNTFFVSQEAATKEIYDNEPTLKTFDFGKGLRYFEIRKEHLDEAHKDNKDKIFPADFKIRVIYAEVGLEFPSNPVKKTRSLDSIGDELCSYQGNETTGTKVLNPSGSSTLNMKGITPTGSVALSGGNPFDNSYPNQEEEGNISDSDTEEEWKKEGMLSAPQTVYV